MEKGCSLIFVLGFWGLLSLMVPILFIPMVVVIFFVLSTDFSEEDYEEE
jgi:hypothetical protein